MWRDGRVLRVLFLGIETAGTQAVAIAVDVHGQGKPLGPYCIAATIEEALAVYGLLTTATPR